MLSLPRLCALTLLAGACLAPAASAKDVITRGKAQRRSYRFEEAGKDMEYVIYVPKTYKKTKKTPLVVALHGLNSNPMQIMLYPGLTRQAEKYGFIVVAPMGYNRRGWYGSLGDRKVMGNSAETGALSEKDVLNVLAIARRDFNINDKRIFLMGHSMGGGGTLHLGSKYPELWAGLGPIAPAFYASPDKLAAIKDIPTIVVQGEADRLVRAPATRRYVEKMKELGMKHEYVEVAGGDHIAPAISELPKIFAFFSKLTKKTRAPAQVGLGAGAAPEPAAPKRRRAY